MKSKIRKLKLSIGFLLGFEALIILAMVILSFKWSWLIFLTAGVGYILFVLHNLVFVIRRKVIIKKFNNTIKENLIFKSYIEKRNYIHNFLIFYTSFFILVFVTIATIVFLFVTDTDNSIALDLLSLISAALVIVSPFLGAFYKKITNITQTEGDMKNDALRKDIKYVITGNTSLNKAINDINLNTKTIELLKNEKEINSQKIVKRLNNRINNINEQISLFEVYLLFEAFLKEIDEKAKIKEFKNNILTKKNLSEIVVILNK
ncbi:unknown transmembrane protein [Mesoplasma florum L1]|uniref:Uncharacterized protein n=1 Tax=Mesoplasma florum (strain ATCC 33453 / NBRC 100688 / NCTC 11704 / L1) TaxID=265311 RepID=Q6F1G5_MESFL|nr:hypothetical protein [Mesoplasma florum]AAT75658.1 unknown transmembrane protein [Mesoplasma florum L1]